MGLVLLDQDSIDDPVIAIPLLFGEGDFLKETDQLVDLVRGQKTKAREGGQITRKLRVCKSRKPLNRTLFVVLADCRSLDCGSVHATRSKTEQSTTLRDRR